MLSNAKKRFFKRWGIGIIIAFILFIPWWFGFVPVLQSDFNPHFTSGNLRGLIFFITHQPIKYLGELLLGGLFISGMLPGKSKYSLIVFDF